MNRTPLERTILKAITQWLDLNKVCYWRNSISPVMRGGGKSAVKFSPNPMRGFPDLSGIIPGTKGQLWAMEVKTEKGRLSTYQVGWQTLLQSEGVAYTVARSLEEAVAFLIDAQIDSRPLSGFDRGVFKKEAKDV